MIYLLIIDFFGLNFYIICLFLFLQLYGKPTPKGLVVKRKIFCCVVPQMDCSMNTCGTIIGLTLALTMTQFLPQTEGSQIKSTLYTKKDSCRVDQSQETPLCRNGTCRGGRASCVYACSTHAQCTSVNFRPSDRLCMGVGNPVYGFRSVVSTDNNWENFSPATGDGNTVMFIIVFVIIVIIIGIVLVIIIVVVFAAMSSKPPLGIISFAYI